MTRGSLFACDTNASSRARDGSGRNAWRRTEPSLCLCQRHTGDRVPLHFGCAQCRHFGYAQCRHFGYAQCKSSGDGARVAQVTPDGVTTLYVGELYGMRRALLP